MTKSSPTQSADVNGLVPFDLYMDVLAIANPITGRDEPATKGLVGLRVDADFLATLRRRERLCRDEGSARESEISIVQVVTPVVAHVHDHSVEQRDIEWRLFVKPGYLSVVAYNLDDAPIAETEYFAIDDMVAAIDSRHDVGADPLKYVDPDRDDWSLFFRWVGDTLLYSTEDSNAFSEYVQSSCPEITAQVTRLRMAAHIAGCAAGDVAPKRLRRPVGA